MITLSLLDSLLSTMFPSRWLFNVLVTSKGWSYPFIIFSTRYTYFYPFTSSSKLSTHLRDRKDQGAEHMNALYIEYLIRYPFRTSQSSQGRFAETSFLASRFALELWFVSLISSILMSLEYYAFYRHKPCIQFRRCKISLETLCM